MGCDHDHQKSLNLTTQYSQAVPCGQFFVAQKER